jgi:predicted peptidase
VSDGAAAMPPSDASTLPPIQAPLPGTVTQGTWQAGDISVPGVTLPSGKAFHYDYLLPANYDPHFAYPILVHEHEDTEGDAWYSGGNGDPLYLASASGADAWYNDVAWRTAYPCIVILPYADQTGGSDAVENFGGWTNTGVTGTGTTFSGDSGPNVFAVAGLVQSFLATYSADPKRVYVTGDSLGGIGSWYMILMYNRVNGPSGRLFTAALPFAGVMEMNGFSKGPTSAQIAQLEAVPVFAVSGANDGTSLPGDWNQPMWQALAGNASYPAPPSGAQAGTSSFHYMQDPNLGHDVWDTYRPLPAGKPLYDWLFSQ